MLEYQRTRINFELIKKLRINFTNITTKITQCTFSNVSHLLLVN